MIYCLILIKFNTETKLVLFRNPRRLSDIWLEWLQWSHGDSAQKYFHWLFSSFDGLKIWEWYFYDNKISIKICKYTFCCHFISDYHAVGRIQTQTCEKNPNWIMCHVYLFQVLEYLLQKWQGFKLKLSIDSDSTLVEGMANAEASWYDQSQMRVKATSTSS